MEYQSATEAFQKVKAEMAAWKALHVRLNEARAYRDQLIAQGVDASAAHAEIARITEQMEVF